eukprot:CAMPEP_0179015156 /NCGR_PEP_ID=MMETSP0796-20121207/2643_1 /TAXON_ID=73915 /ORGANISM="Pyrodinium bahamense, Strain pbaha01" /LENGTH=374 /DNA_ID=CAMNT_0020710775 /DNA_START=12 /DNA_END=1136 /DNA_ORIENTATION=+
MAGWLLPRCTSCAFLLGVAVQRTAEAAFSVAPIIGGQGDFRYKFLPRRLALPSGVRMQHAHGWAVDKKSNIYLTYAPEPGSSDKHCLIRWAPDGTNATLLGPGDSLCAGVPHGLRLATEGGVEFLYHANNDHALHKTTLDGEVVWTITGPPSNDSHFLPNMPTWFSTPPESNYVYMADGYGSNFIHVYTRAGAYAGRSYGGRGTGPGKFQTCHSINFDPRANKLVVTDRENHRHQYFHFDPHSPDKFDFVSEFTIPDLQRPCNMRFEFGHGYAVIPALEGPVGVVDQANKLVSLIDVQALLGDKGHLHPHDATFLPSGDLVVATWNPGRISYWQLLPKGDLLQLGDGHGPLRDTLLLGAGREKTALEEAPDLQV